MTLVGWTFDLDRLKTIVPGLIAMNPLTAICFELLAAALWLRVNAVTARQQRISTGMALVVAVIGGLKLGSYIIGVEIPIDRLLFADVVGNNRLSPNTAFCFLLSGSALAGIGRASAGTFWPAQAATLVVATVSLVTLIGYSFGATSLYQMASFAPMAVHTAVAFGVLAIGILLALPERGVMAVVLDPRAGGVMARRMLPAVMVVPWMLGAAALGPKVGPI